MTGQAAMYRKFGIEDCHIVRCIGVGGFSRVYLI